MTYSSNPVVAILGGGLATRLGALSAGVPKSMIEVAGKPFIAHQLRGVARQGFREVVICAGHLGKMIEDFVGDGSAFGCRVRYSLDGERLLGTGGALRQALPLLGDSFLVMYGDSYLRAPFRPIWQHFVDSEKSALMTVFRNEDRWDRSNVEFAKGKSSLTTRVLQRARCGTSITVWAVFVRARCRNSRRQGKHSIWLCSMQRCW